MDKVPKSKGVPRRDFIKRVPALVGAGVATVAVGKELIEKQIENRSKNVARINKFLRGEEEGQIKMFGQEFSYESFIELLTELIKPLIESNGVIRALLDSFAYMIEVEDRFGKQYNTLPILEKVDRLTEPRLDVASTFGFGQINAQTARNIALEKREGLIEQGLLTRDDIDKLQDPNTSEHEIVDMLDLSGDGNVIFSFLYFVKGYDQYGRSTGGGVHDVEENARARGNLSAERTADPRAFGLAISAYSAKLESPMVAKAQTYVNEMILVDERLKQRYKAEEPGMMGKLLETDGDLGPNTLKALQFISSELDIEPPMDKEKLSNPSFDRLQAMDTWLAKAREKWRGIFVRQIGGGVNDPKVIREIISHRYHGVVSVYTLLKDMMPSQVDRIHELFLAFVDKRDQGFLELVDNQASFEREFGQGQYVKFLDRLNKALSRLVRYDERYRGYIPMGYAAPSRFLSDPRNIMMRVLLAHESDSDSLSRISLD